MGASNEPIIYAVGMVIALTLFLLASASTGKVLTDVFSQMDFQQSRYESTARAYTMVSRGLNYNFTDGEASFLINGVSGEDYCEFEFPPDSITFANKTSYSIISNISIRTRGSNGIYTCAEREDFVNGLVNSALVEGFIVQYPPVAFNVNNPSTGNPGTLEYITPYPTFWGL